MRILQLSTGHLGGAGLAARRLNEALVQAGVKSTFVALENPSFKPSLNEISIRRNLFSRIVGGSSAKIQNYFSRKTLFSSFSINAIPLKTLIEISEPSETILHIHNFQNLVSEKSIKEYTEAGFRIVLTLHDQRYFTGGCHYSFDCTQYEMGCKKCPLLPRTLSGIPRFMLARNPIQGIALDKLTVIAPSNWLITLASNSQILKKFKKQRIDNLLGPDWVRKAQEVRTRKPFINTIGIASMDPTSYIKGGDIVQEILSSSISQEVKFLFLKDIPESRHFEDFWSVIDCLMVASRADNSPNVIHEAKSLGIPVIASRVGGIPELLLESDVCVPIEELTLGTVLEALDKFRNTSVERNVLNCNLRNLFTNQETSLNDHINIYRELFDPQS